MHVQVPYFIKAVACIYHISIMKLTHQNLVLSIVATHLIAIQFESTTVQFLTSKLFLLYNMVPFCVH